MKRNLLLLIAGIILFVVISTIGIYIWNFGNADFATDPQAWGVFGDYFGGILNPTISLASLFVLTYVTYLVAERAKREDKYLFILEQKMKAFDEIAKFIKPINSLMQRIARVKSKILYYDRLELPPDQKLQHVLKAYEELRELDKVFLEFHFTLFELNPRFGTLFKYNFDSQEYKDLLIESKRVSEMISNLSLENSNLSEMQNDLTLKRLGDLFFPVFVKLRSEIEIKS